jgi:hypothetical protein
VKAKSKQEVGMAKLVAITAAALIVSEKGGHRSRECSVFRIAAFTPLLAMFVPAMPGPANAQLQLMPLAEGLIEGATARAATGAVGRVAAGAAGRAATGAAEREAQTVVKRQLYLNLAPTLGPTLKLEPRSGEPSTAASRYGVVCLHNHTDDPINFRVSIGDDSWTRETLAPDTTLTFSHRYKYPNEDRSPIFEVRFNSDLTGSRDYVHKELERRSAVGKSCSEGMNYAFEYERNNRNFIDLNRW